MRNNMRVYELAKSLGVETSKLLDYAKELGFDFLNQLSQVDGDKVVQIIRHVRKVHPAHVVQPVALSAAPVIRLTGLVKILPARIMVKPAAPQPTPPQPASAPSSPPIFVQPAEVPRPPQHFEPIGNTGMERLTEIGRRAGFAGIEKLASLAEIDLDCAMFKIRKLAERLCFVAVKACGIPTEDPQTRKSLTYAELFRIIKNRGILAQKAIQNLDHVRKLGNMAVHACEDPFDSFTSPTNLDVAATSLAESICDVMNRGMIKSPPGTS